METLVTLTCHYPSCGAEFLRTLSKHNKNLKRGTTNWYCSLECKNNARTHSKASYACKECNTLFTARSTSTHSKTFCSRSCSVSWNNRGSPKRKKTTKYCIECGVTEVPRKRKYCDDCKVSKGLLRLHLTKDVSLETLRSTYSVSQYHAKIRGHARSVYRASKKPMSCFHCQYSLHVDVCHIRDVQDFPLSSSVFEVNHVDNLVALCKNHHWEFDHGYLTLDL